MYEFREKNGESSLNWLNKKVLKSGLWTQYWYVNTDGL